MGEIFCGLFAFAYSDAVCFFWLLKKIIPGLDLFNMQSLFRYFIIYIFVTVFFIVKTNNCRHILKNRNKSGNTSFKDLM
jgi:hypothetical protein